MSTLYHKKINTTFNTINVLNEYNRQKINGSTTETRYYEECDPAQLHALASELKIGMLYNENVSSQAYALNRFLGDIGYHTNPGNNGTIFFLAAGSIQVNFYDFLPPDSFVDRLGRSNSLLPEQVSSDMELDILNTFATSINIQAGDVVALNGRKVHTITSAKDAIVFGIKLSYERHDWEGLSSNVFI